MRTLNKGRDREMSDVKATPVSLKCSVCGGDIVNNYLAGLSQCANCGNRWNIADVIPDYGKYSRIIANINKAFNGGAGEVDYLSVHDYYYTSSYGKLDVQFTVLDSWFKPSKNSSYYLSQTMDYYGYEIECGDQLIINEFFSAYNSKMDFSQFDSDNNGTIDAIILINTLEIDSDVTMQWAYRYWNIYTDSNDEYYTYDGVYANDYLWASYQFLFEDKNGGFDNKSALNTYTYIHEFGHVLGADDYYDTSYTSSPMDGHDIMDSETGDHNP